MKLKEIKQSIESNIDLFKETVLKVNSWKELCEYYNLPRNGQSTKYFKKLITNYNLTISHWNWHKLKRKYEWIEKICPVCKNVFISLLGHKREKMTCSCKCSNIYFSNKRHTLEIDKKISDGLKRYFLTANKSRGLCKKLELTCKECEKKILTYNKSRKFCSNKCSAIFSNKNPEYIQKLRNSMLERVKKGIHKGWTSRNITSFPEQFFIKVLNNNNIKFEHNKPFMGYFIDFALSDKMIALEIDGKQHLQEDRKLKDEIKNKVLIDNGWKVYRIPWNCINNDEGKLLMKQKIDGFIKCYQQN